LDPPQSQVVQLGETVSLSVAAGGTPPLAYEWRFQGQLIPAATNRVLQITPVTRSDLGPYQVAVHNSLGTAVSPLATLVLANHPPVATTDGLLTRASVPAGLAASVLLANDTDPDDEPLTLLAVSPLSERGAGITRTAEQVVYLPLPEYVGDDSFAYTIQDSGGLTAAGRVEVRVVTGSLPGARQLTIESLGEAGYRLRYLGLAGANCALQRSVDLRDWTTLATSVIPAHGLIEHTEAHPPAGGAYYRALQSR
jgi:hypothetical protein